MDLNATRSDKVVVLAPHGRIDHLNAEAFGQAVAPHAEACCAGGPALLFDLSGVEYISSAGLRVLMLASKRCVRAGGRLGVAAPSPLVREILEISRFDLVFPVFDSVAQGVDRLSAQAA